MDALKCELKAVVSRIILSNPIIIYLFITPASNTTSSLQRQKKNTIKLKINVPLYKFQYLHLNIESE